MRNFKTFLVCVLIIAFNGSGIKAYSLDNMDSTFVNSPVIATNEKPIPDRILYKDSTTFNVAKIEWVNSAIEVNEMAYGQKVIKWYEDENFITFEFDDNGSKVQNRENETGMNDISEFQVYKIEYLKPGSTLAMTTYSTKIVYYYTWSDGFYTIDSKSGVSFASIANVLMLYTKFTSKLVSWVVGEATGVLFAQIDQSRPVTAETKNKYFYLNKTGAVYIAGVWLPRVYIGSKRAFAWSWTLAFSEYGEPLVLQNGPNNGIGMPPWNYDSIEKKNHYDDETWILNETQLRAFSYAYVDVFYQTTKPLP